ncbi:MAG: acyl carrier protein [Bacteroidetes bacterium]|jgi:acyl carrier protein|nr:acyl carrier protein [Bacteroidota bacterium]MBT6686699.1 acyl carrier protein [Bacteroidota bacterium]MBT7141837.1 acyl carrier protein [Bacteroidota bacterium]MBT7490672.1 acyl carrier protein [Bacteroidota bacterium]
MDRSRIIEKLNSIFREVFKNENLVVTENLCADDIEDWDSLLDTVLLDKVESDFEIKFKFKEIINMENVGDMIDRIVEHLSK